MSNLLAPRMSAVKESPTGAISGKVRDLVKEGKRVINLGEGELDFDTPEAAKLAGIQAICNGHTKYTDVGGTIELKDAIVRKFKDENNLVYASDEVIASSGAKQIIFNAFLATISPGDEVIIPAPYWVSYPDIVNLAGGVPVIVECGEESCFKLTPQILEATLTEKTTWIVLNTPNNPTGAVYTARELRALADVLAHYPRVLVMSDEIYEHITYDHSHESIAAVDSRLHERTLTINGVSKVYSMTGWRLGFAGGPAWLIRALEVLQSQSTSNPSSISQAAAIAALDGGTDFLAPRMEILRKRRARVMDAIAHSGGRLSCNETEGTFYLYANCTGMIGCKTPSGKVIESDIDAADFLLDEGGLAMVPGTAFGLAPYLRIAYSIADNELEEACNLLVEAYNKLS